MEADGTVPKSDNLTGGSRKGIPNKATSAAREAIALFVDGNAHKLESWLLAVANGDPENDIKPNPAKAFEMFQSVVEYHIPKLARTEMNHSGVIGIAKELTEDELTRIASSGGA
jgi:hypothetical protein